MEELEIILEQEGIYEKEISLMEEHGGGTGGTSNYEELYNLPSINGVELIGNKTTKDLGIEAGKEIYIGTEEPDDEDIEVWIDTDEDADQIPTKTSDLENDSKFVDEEYVNQKISEAEIGGGDVDLTGYAKITDIPTKLSELENDKNYLTEVPSEYVTETELGAKGYLTEHQDLSEYAKTSEIPDVSGFITEIPEEYAKKTDIPDVSEFVTQDDVDAAIQNALEVVENGTY